MIRFILFLSAFILLRVASVSANQVEEYLQQQEKTVYFITSYNDNNEWNRRVRSVLLSEMHKSGFLVNLRSIYLDANGLMSKPARRKIVQSYLDGINELVDVFVATDYNAVETMLSFSSAERAHIPLVFVSEFDNTRVSPDSLRLCTGGIAEISFDKIYNNARKMLPNTEKVYVWADKTPLGRNYLREAQTQLAKYEQDIEIEYGVDALSSEQLLKKASELPANSFVIFCTWKEDDTHHYHNPAYFYPLLAETASVPIFPVVDVYVRNGFVGGELISPKLFGELAAGRAIEILKGETPANLPIEKIGLSRVYNQKAMERWGLSESLIPEDARIIDWKTPPHRQMRYQFKAVQITALVLFVFIIILSVLYWQRQKRLQASLFREKLLKQTKQKLKFKSEILSNTIASLREGMATIDSDFKVLECNDVFCKIVAMEHDEIVGQSISSICEFSNRQGMEEQLRKVCAGNVSQMTIDPTFLITRQGVSHYIEGQVLALSANSEENRGAILLIYDVLTEIRQQKIRSISMKAINAYSWFYDKNNDELVFGDGFPTNEIDTSLINNSKKFIERIHPLDRERVRDFFEKHGESQKAEFSINYRLDLDGSGEYEWWECRGIREHSFIGNQPISYLYGVNLNIHIRKKNEQKAEINRQLFSIVGEAAKIGYAKYNMHTGKGFALPQWFKNMELSEENREDFDFRETFNFVSADQRYDLLKFYVKAMCRQETEYRGDKKIITDAGKIKWLHGHMMVLENPEGELELIEVTYDITEQKQVEKDLIVAKNKAESANQLKSAFLANMSHEIRTPLNAIVGFCDLLMLDDCNSEEREMYGNVIRSNNDLLLNLINDILDLSKIEAGFIEFNRSEFDLPQFLSDIKEMFADRIPRNVSFELDVPHAFYSACFDKEKLTQIINNFVNNAIKFTTAGSIRLGYRIHEHEFELFVSDTGVGIRPEDCVKVFERFEKLNSMIPGTGLGLSICKAIVDAAGGDIEVQSVYGKGSTFRIKLPLVVIHPENDQPIEEETFVALPEPDHAPETAKILVAEDIDSNYLLIENLLRDYELHRASNGDEVIDRIQEENYDLILMDMKMPGMNGMDAARIVREFDAEIPIVAVTAYAHEHDRDRIMEAGCNAFIAKPFNRQELRSTVRTMLAQRQ